MKRVFGVRRDTGASAPTVEEASARIGRRGESVDEKVRGLDAELGRYREQIRRARPGPAQEAVKARAMRVLKQKRMYEAQRDRLYGQTFGLDQVAFATESARDARETVAAMRVAGKELKGTMKTLRLEDVDRVQDEMADLLDYSNEVQDALGRSYGVPDDVDEDELLGELAALEDDMGTGEATGDVPSYLQAEPEPVPEPDLIDLPSAPRFSVAPSADSSVDEFGFPYAPRTPIRL